MRDRAYGVAFAEHYVVAVAHLADQPAEADIERRLFFARRQYCVLAGEELRVLARGVCHSAFEHDVVFEVAGGRDTFRMAWDCARPNAVVTVVALYDEPQVLPLPDMYGKNLTFKTGGVDGCHCAETLRLIAEGRIDTTPLITHRFPLDDIERAYSLFESHADGVMKVAITPPA